MKLRYALLTNYHKQTENTSRILGFTWKNGPFSFYINGKLFQFHLQRAIWAAGYGRAAITGDVQVARKIVENVPDFMNISLAFSKNLRYTKAVIIVFAGVLELVDEADSKSVGSDTVWVRVPPPAPAQKFPPPFRFRLAAKTALWWEFLRFRAGFAALDSGPIFFGVRRIAPFCNSGRAVPSPITK